MLQKVTHGRGFPMIQMRVNENAERNLVAFESSGTIECIPVSSSQISSLEASSSIYTFSWAILASISPNRLPSAQLTTFYSKYMKMLQVDGILF